MSVEKVLFVKDIYISSSEGGKDHKCTLVKEEIAPLEPILHATIIMPNGERFFVGHIVIDLGQDKFIVYDDVTLSYYREHLLESTVEKYLKRGWKKRKRRP